MTINVFVATKDENTFSPINKTIAQIEDARIIGQFIETDQSDILQLTNMMRPDILIVDDTLSNSMISIMIKEMVKIFPKSGVIGLYSPEKNNHELVNFHNDRFMKIPKPYSIDNFKYAIGFLMHNILEDYFTKEIPRVSKRKKTSKKFLPFFSPKDSSGKTTVIVNLAWMLSQTFKQKVLILNLNSVFDDSDIYLNYKSNIAFDEFIDNFSSPSVDINSLIDQIAEHPQYKNLYVLSASDYPHKTRNISELENALPFFLWNLESKFDWILIDTSPEINDDALTILEISETPFVLVKNHLISLRNLEIFLEIIKSFGGDINKFLFIATRLSKDVGIKTDQILKLFENAQRFFSFIPSKGKLAMISIAKCVPLITLMKEDDEFYKVFKAMAHRLTGKDPEKKHENYLIKNIKNFFKMQ
ncbi:AAA family ATPase [bacterium]|nr:AAA family ATPase [bacterium]